MKGIEIESVHGEPSISISNESLTVWMTLRGNHISPMVFHLESGDVSPYSLAPWEPGANPNIDPLLDVLRGDFWCLPFGDSPVGPAHGQTASAQWEIVNVNDSSARLRLEAGDIGGQVEKIVSVRDRQSALFQEFIISGVNGRFSYGTHPILDLSAFPSGTARISAGSLRWACVVPGVFSDPELGETQILKPGAGFDDLAAVPMINGKNLDLTRYPTFTTHEDLVMLTQQGDEQQLGWTAVNVPGYTWIALKNIQDFPSTLLWLSNGGRTQVPWQGSHVGRLGVEDVCSYFHRGLVESRKDLLADLAIPTTRVFHESETTTLRSLQIVLATPKSFGLVTSIETPAPGQIRVINEEGDCVESAIDWEFVLPVQSRESGNHLPIN
jgi:hypothetical protein